MNLYDVYTRWSVGVCLRVEADSEREAAIQARDRVYANNYPREDECWAPDGVEIEEVDLIQSEEPDDAL